VSAAASARDWARAVRAAVCDISEPWEHGTVLRATAYPDYYDFNVVRVEEDPGMTAEELAAFADEALAGLEHRRVDLEFEPAAAERLRDGFRALGWLSERLVWMRHEAPVPPGPRVDVEQVHYEAVHHLRVAWFEEDFPDVDPRSYFAQAREVAPKLGAQVLAAFDGGAPVAYAQLERLGDRAELSQLYVRPEHRGAGRGTALTSAVIEAATDVAELWIVADDEGRPKQLYERLGFRPAWTAVELLRHPSAGDQPVR
jgi:GNAT superfamily N-acetyltransferase